MPGFLKRRKYTNPDVVTSGVIVYCRFYNCFHSKAEYSFRGVFEHLRGGAFVVYFWSWCGKFRVVNVQCFHIV